MKREEAAKFFERYLDEEVYTDKCVEAHRLAITALCMPDCGKLLDNGVELLNKADEILNYLENTSPCEDAVSRKEVFEALNSHVYSSEFCKEHDIDYSINLGMANIVVNSLPSVSVKTQPSWTSIKSAERPEIGARVFVLLTTDKIVTAKVRQSEGDTWYFDWEDGNSYYRIIKAWMPIPSFEEEETND